jgi:hypothetical protein
MGKETMMTKRNVLLLPVRVALVGSLYRVEESRLWLIRNL